MDECDIDEIGERSLERVTLNHNEFNHVLLTTKYTQQTTKMLRPGESIPQEIHDNADQFFYLVIGEVVIYDNERIVHLRSDKKNNYTVRAGHSHKVVNPSPTDEAYIFSIYAGAYHPHPSACETKRYVGGSVTLDML